MPRCAVAIGVDHVQGMPPLHAAASGARRFMAWAQTQGIEVTPLTDEDGKRVTKDDVFEAILALVDLQIYEQMIVYFGGHGILKAPLCEQWLLSRARDKNDEAIDVGLSVEHARRAGIPHVVFISDACRSAPASDAFRAVQGGSIFPFRPLRWPRPGIDRFYATAPGDPAVELPTAGEGWQATFTAALLEALRGDVPAVIDDRGATHAPPRFVVWSAELKRHFEGKMLAAAADKNIVQTPELTVEVNDAATFLSAVAGPAGAGAGTHKARVTPAVLVQSLRNDRFLDPRDVVAIEPDEIRAAATETELAAQSDRIAAARGRESFETGRGFTIVGAQIVAARIVPGPPPTTFSENGAHHLRVFDDAGAPQSAVVALSDGTSTFGAVLAVMPGFIGTVLVEKGRIASVSYTPSRNSPLHAAYAEVAGEVERRRAFAAAAARHGAFTLERRDVHYLRANKRVDPSLGLYAAYAYARAGDPEAVHDVYEWMKDDGIVPFDVALLAGELAPRPPGLVITPLCPMLTEGWSRLDTVAPLFFAIDRARRHLVPSLWTTFDEAGIAMLIQAADRGELQ